MPVSDGAAGPLFDVVLARPDRHSAIVILNGELDLASAPVLRDCLAELAGTGALNVVVDLTNLTYMDSTGLSLLITDAKRSSAAGGSFVVRNARPPVMRVFEITGLVDLLSVTPLDPPDEEWSVEP